METRTYSKWFPAEDGWILVVLSDDDTPIRISGWQRSKERPNWGEI